MSTPGEPSAVEMQCADPPSAAVRAAAVCAMAARAIENADLLQLAELVRSNDFDISADIDENNDSRLLRQAVHANNAAALEILATVGFRADYIRAHGKYLFSFAAQHGLADIFRAFAACGLTADDARAFNNNTLYLATVYNRPEVLQVLAVVYGLSREDVLSCDAFQDAAALGCAEVLRVFASAYGLTAADARADNNKALRSAVRKGRPEVLEVLAVVYGLGPADARGVRGGRGSARVKAAVAAMRERYYTRSAEP